MEDKTILEVASSATEQGSVQKDETSSEQGSVPEQRSEPVEKSVPEETPTSEEGQVWKDKSAPSVPEDRSVSEDKSAEISDKKKATTNILTIKSVASQINHRIKQIDRTVLPAKFSYVFEVGRKMMTQAMLILFLTSIGLHKEETGLILGFRYVLYYRVFFPRLTSLARLSIQLYIVQSTRDEVPAAFIHVKALFDRLTLKQGRHNYSFTSQNESSFSFFVQRQELSIDT